MPVRLRSSLADWNCTVQLAPKSGYAASVWKHNPLESWTVADWIVEEKVPETRSVRRVGAARDSDAMS
jgi:hypothetical protein